MHKPVRLPPLITYPQHHFKALNQQERLGGSSFDLQMFEHTEDGSWWIGKCDIRAATHPGQQVSAGRQRYYDECREWLGLACYRSFGVKTPDFGVSMQDIAPEQRRLLKHPEPCLHIMTRFEQAFHPLGEDFLPNYQKAAEQKEVFMIQGRPLKGFGATLAVAGFLFDMDCLGISGGNLGYIFDSGQAQVMKIDAGMAFSFLDQHTDQAFAKDNPMTRTVTFAPRPGKMLSYSELTAQDQAEFSETAQRILKTPRAFFSKIARQIVIQQGWTSKQVAELVERLIARKSLFIAGFSQEIHQGLKQDALEAKQRLLSRVWEKSSHHWTERQLIQYHHTLDKIGQWHAELSGADFEHGREGSLKERVFQCPQFNEYFTGRHEILAQLSTHFSTTDHVVVQSLEGMAGIGKTQCAIRYLHAAAQHEHWTGASYDHILWFHVDMGMGFQLKALAKAWKKPHSDEQEAITSVCVHLRKRRTLLVLDNAEPDSDLNVLKALVNIRGCCHVLITTRTPSLEEQIRITVQKSWVKRLLSHGQHPLSVQTTVLNRFATMEGRTYILRMLHCPIPPSTEAMDALIELVDGVPLALHQAVQYIASGQTTLEAYPHIFSQHQLSCGVRLHDSPVRTTVLMALLPLCIRNPNVEPLLVSCAYLAPDQIPIELISAFVPDQSPPTLQVTLRLLQRHGFIQCTNDSGSGDAITHFHLHRLVQAVLRHWHVQNMGHDAQQDVIQRGVSYFIERFSYDERDMEAAQKSAPWVPHALSIGSTPCRHRQNLLPHQAALYDLLAEHQFQAGSYLAAKNISTTALQWKEAHYGQQHQALGTTLHNLGRSLRELKDYDGAASCLQRAVSLHQAHYGAHHDTTACSRVHLGTVLWAQRKLDGARALYEQALPILQSRCGADHPETARCMTNLGTILYDLDEPFHSRDYLERSLDINTRYYGPEHPKVATVLINLTRTLQRLHHHQTALQYAKRALSIFRSHYGGQHPRTQVCLNLLIGVLSQLGHDQEAKSYIACVLEIDESYYGIGSLETVPHIVHIARLERRTGDTQEALKHIMHALKLLEQCEDHDPLKIDQQRAGALELLGLVYHHNLGALHNAKACYEQALDLKRQRCPLKLQDIAVTLTNLGTLLGELGEPGQAICYLKEAWDIKNTYYHGVDHYDTAVTLTNLGGILAQTGQYKASRHCLQRALSINQQHYGNEHPETHITHRIIEDLNRRVRASQHCPSSFSAQQAFFHHEDQHRAAHVPSHSEKKSSKPTQCLIM